jgi:hypothetical protein
MSKQQLLPRTSRPEADLPSPLRARRNILESIHNLLDELTTTPNPDFFWHDLEKRLRALPLATADFALFLNRLRNARSYVDSGEPGAARFELAQFLGALARELA